MRDTMFSNQRENARRFHAAQADMRTALQRDSPGIGPAIAMKHRQRPKIDALRIQPKG